MAEEEDNNMIGSSFSLVRYNNPVLIDKHTESPSPTTPTPGKGGKPGKGGDEATSGQPSKTRPKSAGETSEASTAAKQVCYKYFFSTFKEVLKSVNRCALSNVGKM